MRGTGLAAGNEEPEGRSRRALPIERTLSADGSSDCGGSSGLGASRDIGRTAARGVERLDYRQPDSPGTSKGLASLSLGLGGGSEGERRVGRGERGLRSRKVEPWRVGGL